MGTFQEEMTEHRCLNTLTCLKNPKELELHYRSHLAARQTDSMKTNLRTVNLQCADGSLCLLFPSDPDSVVVRSLLQALVLSYQPQRFREK